MKIKIRVAKRADVGEIFKLGLATKELWVSSKTKFYSKKELFDWIKKPRGNLFLVAVNNKKVVGFSFTKIMSSEWAMGDTMAVDPKYRKLGIGSLLH